MKDKIVSGKVKDKLRTLKRKQFKIGKPRGKTVADVRKWLNEIALKASFNPKKYYKGSLYGPEEDIYPEHWRKYRKMNYSEYMYYSEKAAITGGFDVSGCTGRVASGILEVNPSNTKHMYYAKECAKFAVREYNHQVAINPNDKRPTLRFLEMVRANVQHVSGANFFITLWARDVNNGDENLYRAKVFWAMSSHLVTLRTFKESPLADLRNPALVRKSDDEPADEWEERVDPKENLPFYLSFPEEEEKEEKELVFYRDNGEVSFIPLC